MPPPPIIEDDPINDLPATASSMNSVVIIRELDKTMLEDPKNYGEAMASPEAPKWMGAMDKESKSLAEHDTWVPCMLPVGKKAIGCRWVFKRKIDANGNVKVYKARLVAQGFTQIAAVDYTDTYAPVMHYKTLRLVLAIVAQKDYEFKQMDVPTAFLNATCKEELYMRLPPGMEKNHPPGTVCRLLRTLYGIKQAPREWNLELNSAIKALGYTRLTSDTCVYVKDSKTGNKIILPIFVDDMFPACHKDDLAEMIEDMGKLMVKYGIPTIDDADVVLGMRVTRDRMNRIIHLDQTVYTERLLAEYNMTECTIADTPAPTRSSNTKSAATMQQHIAYDTDMGYRTKDGQYPHYGNLVGSLMYASLSTRPDIAHATSMLSRALKDPKMEDWVAAKRVLRYLRGTTSLGLTFGYDGLTDDIVLGSNFCDADWAGDLGDRRSMSGYVMKVAGAPIAWCSKKQPCVSRSSAESEYMAAGAAVCEIIWLRTLLRELGFEQKAATVLLCDNQPAIAIASNDVHHNRTKHIDIQHHFIREVIDRGQVTMKWVSSKDNEADILTKPLSGRIFLNIRTLLLGEYSVPRDMHSFLYNPSSQHRIFSLFESQTNTESIHSNLAPADHAHQFY
jgi:hypothetical protein